MKKFIITVFIVILCIFGFDLCYYKLGWFVDINPNKEINYNIKQEGKKILINKNNKWENFEIKGVDMGVGIPGHFTMDFAIKKETYKRWFKQIQDMGANTVRVYTILHPDFYNALYEYNKNNSNPIYIMQGVWINDYIQNSHIDAYNSKFIDKFLGDSKIAVDVIHGNKKINLGRKTGTGHYNKDISQWVIGYILGVEWEDVTVAYTDNLKSNQNKKYIGEYVRTLDKATPFETMLAIAEDKIIEYETSKYKAQRLVAFSNWLATDPFDYEDKIESHFKKISKIDVEHIEFTNKVLSGTFASYNVYPYYQDYLRYDEKYKNSTNTYLDYLINLNNYHKVPVVISEFGVPSSRGMAQREKNGLRNQGRLNERQQGESIVSMYNDIKKANCAGSIIFSWQDEYLKRTWNTMHSVDLTKAPYWSDYQTPGQGFGLLSFDPGKVRSISYIDGDIEEWTDTDIVTKNNNLRLSMKYDEKFIYFYVSGYNPTEKLYIPLDITPNSGSNKVDNIDINLDKNIDFLIVIDGKENSRVLVQEYYDDLKANFSYEVYSQNAYTKENMPVKNSTKFNNINLILQAPTNIQLEGTPKVAEIYETGKLTHGNANPNSKDFNSLADFNINCDKIEIKLPWQMLNFSNPSEMVIHDDYYKNYGVKDLKINFINVGVGSIINKDIKLEKYNLKGWKQKPTYHERLKSSYYIVQDMWKER